MDIKGFHMSLKACAYRTKGMMLCLAELNAIQFVRGVCETKYKSFSSTSE